MTMASRWSLQSLAANRNIHLVWCTGGIMLSMMVYSILQERIMTQPYGAEGELFRFSLFLVLSNRLTTCALSIACLLWLRQDLRPVAPAYGYAAVSLSNVVATTCQYEALKYVTFPLQTLGKCAKMLPVMAWGSLIQGKRYKSRDYLLVAAITAGVSLFFLTGRVSSRNAAKTTNAVAWGATLMLGYLGFDGFTSTVQDWLFKGYNMSIYNQMLYVNAFSFLVSLFGLLSGGQLAPAIGFFTRHPEALSSVLVLSVSATMGQLFIVHTIRRFGALVFAAVMTTRQFLSILVSSILFRNPLSAGQWLGTAMVFVALYYRSAASAKANQAAGEGRGAGLQTGREPLLPAGKGSPGPKRQPAAQQGASQAADAQKAPWDVEAHARADSIPALRKD